MHVHIRVLGAAPAPPRRGGGAARTWQSLPLYMYTYERVDNSDESYSASHDECVNNAMYWIATARVKELWNVGGKAGIQLEATQIVLRPGDRPKEVDAFSNDAELLA